MAVVRYSNTGNFFAKWNWFGGESPRLAIFEKNVLEQNPIHGIQKKVNLLPTYRA